MQQGPLDLASFIAAVFGVFVAPKLAHLMGVYAAIFISAVAGAGIALIRAETMSRGRSMGFLTLMASVSIITTVGVAEIINHFLKLQSITPLLAPLAMAIAALGKDWPRIASGAWEVSLRVFERRVGGPRDDPGYYGGYRGNSGGRFTRKNVGGNDE